MLMQLSFDKLLGQKTKKKVLERVLIGKNKSKVPIRLK